MPARVRTVAMAPMVMQRRRLAALVAMAVMPVPWASVVPRVLAMAVVPVPMVRVLTVAVAVRPVRALLPRPRAWPAVTVVLVVPVAMPRVRARPVTVVPVASAVMVTTA